MVSCFHRNLLQLISTQSICWTHCRVCVHRSVWRESTIRGDTAADLSEAGMSHDQNYWGGGGGKCVWGVGGDKGKDTCRSFFFFFLFFFFSPLLFLPPPLVFLLLFANVLSIKCSSARKDGTPFEVNSGTYCSPSKSKFYCNWEGVGGWVRVLKTKYKMLHLRRRISSESDLNIL